MVTIIHEHKLINPEWGLIVIMNIEFQNTASGKTEQGVKNVIKKNQIQWTEIIMRSSCTSTRGWQQLQINNNPISYLEKLTLEPTEKVWQ